MILEMTQMKPLSWTYVWLSLTNSYAYTGMRTPPYTHIEFMCFGPKQ